MLQCSNLTCIVIINEVTVKDLQNFSEMILELSQLSVQCSHINSVDYLRSCLNVSNPSWLYIRDRQRVYCYIFQMSHNFYVIY